MSVSSFDLGPWQCKATKSTILKSIGPEHEAFAAQLELPNIPDMLFDKNAVSFCLRNISGLSGSSQSFPSISFNALDALRLVDPKKSYMEVASASKWRNAREDIVIDGQGPGLPEVYRPFDWTYTTPYTGSLSADWIVEPTEEQIDYEVLKRRDRVLFFTDVDLYEDELGDNGMAHLNLKLRCMESGFFLLQRFFLRVDGKLLRIYDTRLWWPAGAKYLLREIRRKEEPLALLTIPTGSDGANSTTGSSNNGGTNAANVAPHEAEEFCTVVVAHFTEKLTHPAWC